MADYYREQVKMAQESAKNMHMVISRALQRHPKIDRVMYMPHSPRLSFEARLAFKFNQSGMIAEDCLT